jgi:hypothetical protein
MDVDHSVVKRAVALVANCAPMLSSQLGDSAAVMATLGLQRISVSGRTAAEARRALDTMLGSQGSQQVGGHLRWAAETARRARSLGSLHHECPDTADIHLGTFKALCERVGESMPEAATAVPVDQSLALWSIARVAHEGELTHNAKRLIIGSEDAQQNAAVLDSVRRPLPGPNVRRRKAHLKRLLRPVPGAFTEYETFENASGVSPEEMEWLISHHYQLRPLASGPCYCAVPSLFGGALLLDGPPHPWIRLAPSEPWRRLLADAQAIAQPRLDVLVLDDHALVTDMQGWSDSFFLAALLSGGSDRASQWHESALAREARLIGNHWGRTNPNACWVSDRTNPSSHDGEVDVALTVDGVLLDFQAKAPAAPNFRSRFKTADTDALDQHRRLRETVGASAHVVKRARNEWTVTDTVWHIPSTVKAHIPVTVGVEAARQWSLGTLDRHALGRVHTTLDHVELANEWIPDVFRPAYWLDRYLAQFGASRFIDEIDFLGRWITRLKGRESPLGRWENGLVHAEWNDVERHLWLDNTIGHGDKHTAIRQQLTQSRHKAVAGLPHLVAPAFCSALRSAAAAKQDNWLILALHCLGVRWDAFGERFRSRTSFQLAQRECTWAVVFSDVRAQALPYSGVDCALVQGSRGWSVWTREGFSDAFWDRVRRGALTRRELGLTIPTDALEPSELRSSPAGVLEQPASSD